MLKHVQRPASSQRWARGALPSWGCVAGLTKEPDELPVLLPLEPDPDPEPELDPEPGPEPDAGSWLPVAAQATTTAEKIVDSEARRRAEKERCIGDLRASCSRGNWRTS